MNSFPIIPRFKLIYVVDRGEMNFVFFGQHAKINTRCYFGSYLLSLFHGKLWGVNAINILISAFQFFWVRSRSIFITGRRSPIGCYFNSRSLPSFINHVLGVVVARSDPKMVGIYAWRIIASMADAHAIGYGAFINTIGYAMRSASNVSDEKPSVSFFVNESGPYPAFAGRSFSDLPVPIFDLAWRQCERAISIIFNGGHSLSMAVARALESLNTAPTLAPIFSKTRLA